MNKKRKENLEVSDIDIENYLKNTIEAPWKSSDTPENTSSLVSLENKNESRKKFQKLLKLKNY